MGFWTRGLNALDLLPNLPPSGGYENKITAMDGFSRCRFPYPVRDALATNTTKLNIDIMTKHNYVPKTLTNDKNIAFRTKLVNAIAHILGILIRRAKTKNP